MLPGDLVAARAGDVAIEHRDVVAVDAQQLQPGVAIAGDVGGDRLQPQAVADRLRQAGFVLDDQHAHAPMLEPHVSPVYRELAYATATAPPCWTATTALTPLHGPAARSLLLLVATSVALLDPRVPPDPGDGVAVDDAAPPAEPCRSLAGRRGRRTVPGRDRLRRRVPGRGPPRPGPCVPRSGRPRRRRAGVDVVLPPSTAAGGPRRTSSSSWPTRSREYGSARRGGAVGGAHPRPPPTSTGDALDLGGDASHLVARRARRRPTACAGSTATSRGTPSCARRRRRRLPCAVRRPTEDPRMQ